MYTLYSMQRSGNCYKVRLALAQLDLPYKIVDHPSDTSLAFLPEIESLQQDPLDPLDP